VKYDNYGGTGVDGAKFDMDRETVEQSLSCMEELASMGRSLTCTEKLWEKSDLHRENCGEKSDMHGGTDVDEVKYATHPPVMGVKSEITTTSMGQSVTSTEKLASMGVKYVIHRGNVVDGVKSATHTPVKGDEV